KQHKLNGNLFSISFENKKSKKKSLNPVKFEIKYNITEEGLEIKTLKFHITGEDNDWKEPCMSEHKIKPSIKLTSGYECYKKLKIENYCKSKTLKNCTVLLIFNKVNFIANIYLILLGSNFIFLIFFITFIAALALLMFTVSLVDHNEQEIIDN
ncbi:hypothetical protein MXB_1087, partial [Myxobolus squamalis]